METQETGMNGSIQSGIQSVTVSREALIRSYHDDSVACEASVSYEISDSVMEEFLCVGAKLLAELYVLEMGLEHAEEEVAE